MSDSKQVQVAGRFIIITCFITTPSFDRSDFNESFSLSLIEMLDQASGWGGGTLGGGAGGSTSPCSLWEMESFPYIYTNIA